MLAPAGDGRNHDRPFRSDRLQQGVNYRIRPAFNPSETLKRTVHKQNIAGIYGQGAQTLHDIFSSENGGHFIALPLIQ